LKANPFLMLGAGAALATCALFLMSQGIPPSGSHYSGTWGPPKKNVVNLFEEFTNSVTIQPGAEYVVYTVPADRWLTVTQLGAYAGTAGVNSVLRWAESYSGSLDIKGRVYDGGLDYQTPLYCSPRTEIGWVFRPGSQVVLKSSSSGPLNLSSFSLIGYLSRE
jgi:hypothetical protein